MNEGGVKYSQRKKNNMLNWFGILIGLQNYYFYYYDMYCFIFKKFLIEYFNI